MDAYITNFIYWWDHFLGPQWDIVIPVLLVLTGIIWLFGVYLRGKFRFLPALAIARVTIQDSIGRMEVVILLLIGVLVLGVNGIIPNTAQGRNTLDQWMNLEIFQERLKEWGGGVDITEYETGSLPGTNLSVVNGESGTVSIVPGETDTGSPEIQDTLLNADGEISPDERPEGVTAEEFSESEQQRKMQSLIWQGAFLMADFFVALIGFVLAMVVLPTELNRGVILSILPKPVTREEYVYGKALGIWVIVAGCFLLLSLELFSIRAIFAVMDGRNPVDWNLVKAMALFPFKYFTLVLIIMGMTLRMPEVPAAIVGLAIFGCGHFHDRIFEISQAPDLALIFKIPLKISYWMIPHLSQVTFSILDVFQSLITSWEELWGWVWQITIYNILLLWLLSYLFRRRSL
ncbi:MAG TPA: ABC transporter permease subunit [bacterium]|jgi:ABC-type transport system involved in multi-copper enzyme maturation permease subunit